MKKNQHILDKKTYQRYKDLPDTKMLGKNNKFVNIDWAEINNRIQETFYWESNLLKENDIENKLESFEKQWGLIRQSIFSSEINKKHENWLVIYYLLFIWIKAKIDDIRVFMFRSEENIKEENLKKIICLLNFSEKFINKDFKEYGPKLLKKNDFLTLFFSELKQLIKMGMFTSYPFVFKEKENNSAQVKLDLENQDFANPLFWFVREMIVYSPEIIIRVNDASKILPFQRKIDMDLFFKTTYFVNIDYFNDIFSKKYNFLSIYKYIFWCDEKIIFGTKFNIDELIRKRKVSKEKAWSILFDTNNSYFLKILDEMNQENLADIFLDMIGISFRMMTNNKEIFFKIDEFFFMIQNNLEKCLFRFQTNHLDKLFTLKKEISSILNSFYDGYNFKKHISSFND